MSNFGRLSAFMQSYQGGTANLAKIMVAWIWTSVEPGGYGPPPTTGQSVATVLNGSCGWKDYLLTALFAEIGVKARRANFHDVPVQEGHSATELLINGKWMFFDSTFGTYFERRGGGQPLSIAEARSAWPDVVIKKVSLPGWQGTFVDPRTISFRDYATITDTVAHQPKTLNGFDDVVSGELDSIYFGPKASYLDAAGVTTQMPPAGHKFGTYVDTSNKYGWSKIVKSFDASGRLDTTTERMDDGAYRFHDKDLLSQHAWREKTVAISPRNILDWSLTTYDDSTSMAVDYDETRLQDFKSAETHTDATGQADYVRVVYDDGRVVFTENDFANCFAWASHEDRISADGASVVSTIVADGGGIEVVDWTPLARLGTASSDVLSGVGGRAWLRGFDGSDTLIGSDESDRLEGGAGDDTYVLHSRSFVYERPDEGVDTAVIASNGYVLGPNLENLILEAGVVYGTGNELRNMIVGNGGDNILNGQAGDDWLLGLDGSDVLAGGDGRDTLEGGPGSDVLVGGRAADTYIWRTVADASPFAASADVIRDFSRAQGDRIHLATIDANVNAPGNQAFSFIGVQSFSAAGQIHFTWVGGNTIISLNTDADSTAEAVIRLARRQPPTPVGLSFRVGHPSEARAELPCCIAKKVCRRRVGWRVRPERNEGLLCPTD